MNTAPERALRAQGQQTKARLLDAGMQVLTERGYLAARVDDVVRVADMSHGTFYLYFSNKEDLFRALAQECAAEMEALAETLGPIDAGKKGEAELRRWLTAFVATYRQYGPVIRAWMEDQLSDPKLIDVGLSAFASITETLEQRVRDFDPPHVSHPGVATAAMLAMVERLAYFTSSRDLGVDDVAVVETMTTLLHRGVFGGRAAKPATRRRATASKRN